MLYACLALGLAGIGIYLWATLGSYRHIGKHRRQVRKHGIRRNQL